MQSKKQNILLLTDVFPCNNYSGGIASQQLCYFLLEEKQSLHCALLKQKAMQEDTDDLIKQNIKTITFKKPEENTSQTKFDAQTISRTLEKYIKDNDISIVWCPIQGETLLLILHHLQKTLPKIRFVSQILDTIEWKLKELKYNANNRQNILKIYDEVISNSDYVLTASSYMNELYTKKYKVPCSPIYTSFQITQTNNSIAKNKNIFLKSLGLQTSNEKSLHILEVNNVDLPGKRWNGYDLLHYINNNTPHLASQICTHKTSDDPFVTKIYSSQDELNLEANLLDFEANNLSVHSCLSSSSPILPNKPEFKKADVVHLHLIHNFKLSLFSLIKICNKKPTVMTIHDPWFFTGRCVYFGNCKKYLTGCHNCPNLKTLFPLKYDNCSELWKLKKYVYSKLDIDYIVTTQYMYDLFVNSPIIDSSRVHLIPFGMNIDEFTKVDKDSARKHYNIPDDEIVIFHRAQVAAKGTNYLLDALKELNTDKKITILTCSEKNLLDEIRNKYRIIDLGDIDVEELSYAFNACDMYVMPSLGESFGFMAIEAMSCSKPIIVFNNTAMPSVTFAPECGIAVENYNSHELMKAIKHLAENEEERLRRGKLCRKAVEDNYKIETYHQKLISLYEEIANRKHEDKTKDIPTEIKNTDDVIELKKRLNILTKKLFPKNSPYRNKLLYPINNETPKKQKIAYSDINVQLLLDQYNSDVTDYYSKSIEFPIPLSSIRKIIKKSKTFLHLLFTDKKRIMPLIKSKLNHKITNSR